MRSLSLCLFVLTALLVGCGGGGGGAGSPSGPAPFTLSPIAATAVTQGNQTVINLTLTTTDRSRAPEEEVAITVEGLPEGVEAAIDPPAVVPTAEGAPCEITLTADPGTCEGDYTATVKATRGEEEATQSFDLTVELDGPVGLVVSDVTDFAKDADTSIYTATFTVRLDNPGARRTITLNSTPKLHFLWAEPKWNIELVGETEQHVKIRFPQNNYEDDSLDITTTITMEGAEETVVQHLETSSGDAERTWVVDFRPRDTTINAVGSDNELTYDLEVAGLLIEPTSFDVRINDSSAPEPFYAVVNPRRFRFSMDGGPIRKAILKIGRNGDYTGSDAVHVAYFQIEDENYQRKVMDFYIPFYLNDRIAP